MWFLALTIVEIKCCIWMDCPLLSWSHSCKDVLSQIDSSQRGFWQLLISQRNGSYMNWSHQTLEKVGNEENTWICTNKSCFAPFLIYKVDLGQNITSSTQTKQHHAESAASLLISLLWSHWGFEAHSQFKEMDCDDKRELSLLYPHMLGKLPWKCSKFPLLLPQMSVPQAQTQLFL